ncbi:Hint domain-containing protein [Pseudooceanicola sp. 200-1SW]|uniref:Hint domain-containing protein n=1 Tax=Pseudooceanicola sp. 200-1SW TaxID=3425949 RepID=UPI003D7F68DD
MTTSGSGSGDGQNINGSWQNDDLDGTCRDDTISGYGGNDDIAGKRGDDVIYGGDGNDTITGDAGHDSIDGGTGSDKIYGGSGDDTIDGGDTNDTLYGGAGDDSLFGGNVSDKLYGGSGDDSLYGGEAEDSLYGGDGNDLLDGGNSRDILEGGAGNDTFYGGESEDHITAGSGDDSIDGGNSNDTIYGGDGNDTIDGGGGDDSIEAGRGNDSVYGGQGQDRIWGQSGDDFLEAGDTAWDRSTDTLYGGQGDDTLRSNGNQDQLYGGSGDDLFTAIADDSNLNNLYVYGGEDPGDTDWDVLDLSEFKERYPDLQLIYSNVSADGEDGTILMKTGDGRELGRIYYKDIEQITTDSPNGAICFAPGSLIATMRGEVPVEQLRAGDRVITRDNGMQELRWIGRRELSAAELARMPHLQPVLLRAGALGQGLPHTDLVVSPQHRMLIRSDRASLLYEENEVLVAAKDLVGMAGVERLANRSATYLHLLFDQHEVILANGAWSESFQPGDYSMKTLDQAQRAEIHYLFPELASARAPKAFGAARRSLKKHEAEVLRAEGGIVTRAEPAILSMPQAYRGR